MSAQKSQIETRSMLRKRRADEALAVSAAERAEQAKRMAASACLTCKRKEAVVATARCQHLNYCLECFQKSDRWRHNPQTCERCGVQVWSYEGRGQAATVERAVDMFCLETDAARQVPQQLSTLIQMSNATNLHVPTFILSLVSIVAAGYRDGRFPLLSVDSCERLLTECNTRGLYQLPGGGGSIRNVLVSFCRYPWRVDVAVGSHGVCYHGNMGRVENVCEALRCVENNIKFITGRNQYY